MVLLLGFKAQAASPITDEFRNIPWGSDLYKNHKFECEFSYMFGAHDCKEKEHDLNIWGIKVETLEYGMNFEKQFDLVSSTFKGKENFERIKKSIIAEFTNQYKGDLANNALIYTWDSNDIKIELISNSIYRNFKTEPFNNEFYSLNIEKKKYFKPRAFQTWEGNSTLLDCNLNQDAYCDDKDVAILKESMNQCNKPGDYKFNSDADLDKDGCVTEKDLDKLLSYGKTKGWIDKTLK